jgi:hypothetical protein
MVEGFVGLAPYRPDLERHAKSISPHRRFAFRPPTSAV